MVSRSTSRVRRLARAQVDIDAFTPSTTASGRPRGIGVIRDLARLRQKRLRSTDLIGRPGGGRFLVLLGDATGESAQVVVDQIRRSFAELRSQATLRAGIASFLGQPEAEFLLDAAEKAAARASRAGGDRVERATE